MFLFLFWNLGILVMIYISFERGQNMIRSETNSLSMDNFNYLYSIFCTLFGKFSLLKSRVKNSVCIFVYLSYIDMN